MKRDIHDVYDPSDQSDLTNYQIKKSSQQHDQGEPHSESPEKAIFPSTNEAFVHESLIPWMKSTGFTGLQHLEFKYSSECGNSLGCFALKPFHLNEVIFEVPQTCIFSLHSITSTSPLTNFITSFAKENNCSHLISKEFLMWLHMIAERAGRLFRNQRNSESNPTGDRESLQTYFQSLSRISPSVISWEERLISALEGTNVGNSIVSLRQQIRESVDILQRIHHWNPVEAEKYLPKEHFHYQSIVWAAGHYLSRRYPAHFGDFHQSDEEKRKEEPMNHKRDHELLGNHGALVPLLDILNHKAERSWIRFEIKNQKLQIICNYPIQQVNQPLLYTTPIH